MCLFSLNAGFAQTEIELNELNIVLFNINGNVHSRKVTPQEVKHIKENDNVISNGKCINLTDWPVIIFATKHVNNWNFDNSLYCLPPGKFTDDSSIDCDGFLLSNNVSFKEGSVIHNGPLALKIRDLSNGELFSPESTTIDNSIRSINAFLTKLIKPNKNNIPNWEIKSISQEKVNEICN